MRPAGLDRKVGAADADRAFGVGGPKVGDLAFPDHAGERIRVVARDLGSLGQGQQLIALVPERLLDLDRRPFEGAGPGLIAESLSEFLGFGADLSDGFVNGACS